METLYTLAGLGIFGIILVGLLMLLTEKAEVQIFIGITSMGIGYLLINILSINNNFTSTLIIGGLLISILGFKTMPRRRFL